MAKPQHTAYMVMADFSHLSIIDHDVMHDGPVGLAPSCINRDRLKETTRWQKQFISMKFNIPEESYVTFGFEKANKLLKDCRTSAKQQFKKGKRPTFFLRKMTMSEFIAHPEFKKYRTSNLVVKSVFKKYLLLDQLRDGGFQTS